MIKVLQIIEVVLTFLGIDLQGFIIVNIQSSINWSTKIVIIQVTFEDLTPLEDDLLNELTKWLEKYEHFSSLSVSGNVITITVTI
jgi:hypothetical protein